MLIDIPASNGRGMGRLKARQRAVSAPTTAVLQLVPPPQRYLPDLAQSWQPLWTQPNASLRTWQWSTQGGGPVASLPEVAFGGLRAQIQYQPANRAQCRLGAAAHRSARRLPEERPRGSPGGAVVAPLPGVTRAVHAVRIEHRGLLACPNRSQGSMLPASNPINLCRRRRLGRSGRQWMCCAATRGRMPFWNMTRTRTCTGRSTTSGSPPRATSAWASETLPAASPAGRPRSCL